MPVAATSCAVMNTVSSPLYGLKGRVQSVQQAVTYLGVREISAIAYENGFKIQWEDFIRHVVADTPWKFDLLEGVKGVQLAELGLKSWHERRWLDVPEVRL